MKRHKIALGMMIVSVMILLAGIGTVEASQEVISLPGMILVIVGIASLWGASQILRNL